MIQLQVLINVEHISLLTAVVTPCLFSFILLTGDWLIQIHSLKYRIQHESIPLSEEKQILREIKQLVGTREKVMANAAMSKDSGFTWSEGGYSRPG